MLHKYNQLKPIIAILLIVISILFITACNRGEKEEPRKTIIPVETGNVKVESFSVPVRASGRLYPRDMAKLSFKTGGIISHIPVSEGQAVKAGTLLATLDTCEIDATVAQAREAMRKSKRDLKRVTNLYNDKAATLEQLEDVTTAAKIAEARVKIALFNSAHSRVIAPSNGIVLKRLAEANETIAPGYPVILFGSLDTQWVVKVGVTESQLIHLSSGDRALIRFDAYQEETCSAVVSEIARTIDASSQTYEVQLTLEPLEKRLAAGFVAKAEIFPTQQETYRWIPISAIVEGEGKMASVYTVKRNKACKIPIRIAHILDGRVLAAKGLEEVGTVVTEGAAYLADGAEVIVVSGPENQK